VLDAVGYNLSQQAAGVPEPGTISLFGSSFALLAGMIYRRKRR
jgi:hypothetical protein